MPGLAGSNPIARGGGVEAHGVGIAALPFLDRLELGEAHAGALQQHPALRIIAVERGELAPGEPSDRLAEIERRPGQVLRPVTEMEHAERHDEHRGEKGEHSPAAPLGTARSARAAPAAACHPRIAECRISLVTG